MELKYVTVGVIVNTHGLRGEARVIPKTDIPERRFTKGSTLLVRESGRDCVRELKVTAGRPHKQFWLVTFEGIEDVAAVEKLKGMELCIPVSELPELEEGSFYIHELIGLDVVTDEGHHLGTLTDVLTPGANDVYVVHRTGAKDVLIPAIKDCILDVNHAKKQMTVHLLPGLLDEE